MNYHDWCREVGICPDSETREVWEFKDNQIDKMIDEIINLIIESDPSPKMVLHEPFRSLMHSVSEIKDKYVTPQSV